MSEKKYTIELTEEQLQQLGIKVPNEENNKIKSPFDRVKGQNYFYIAWGEEILEETDLNSSDDDDCYDIANYCTDEKLLHQRALHEALDRLLWRFTYQNGWNEDLWEDKYTSKYKIVYDNEDKDFGLETDSFIQSKDIYFISEKIALRAIDEIVLPFMNEHPEFVW